VKNTINFIRLNWLQQRLKCTLLFLDCQFRPSLILLALLTPADFFCASYRHGALMARLLPQKKLWE
jgi:hypothetical protein